MLLVIAAALFGFLGRGPFSHRTITDNARLAVDYEPVARYGATTQITLHLHAAAADEQQVVLSSTFVEPFGLSQILPRPVSEIPNGGGLTLKFATPAEPDDAEIRFQVSPSDVGPVHLSVRLGGGEARSGLSSFCHDNVLRGLSMSVVLRAAIAYWVLQRLEQVRDPIAEHDGKISIVEQPAESGG